MLSLNVDLAELLGSLLEVHLGLVELLLQKLNLASEVLAGGAVSVTFLGGTLKLLDLDFVLLDLVLGEGELVLQRGNLLVTLEKGLAELRC